MKAVIAVVAIFGIGMVAVNQGWLSMSVSELGRPDSGGIVSTVEKTAGVTLALDAYTGDWGNAGSETEVYPTYTIVDQDGNKIVNDATANTTTLLKQGDAYTISSTGSTYYFDQKKGTVALGDTTPKEKLNAYAAASTANMDIVAYTEDGVTALTADDNSNNTVDYAGGSLGAGEDYDYPVRVKLAAADVTFRLGAILLYDCGGEVEDYTLTGMFGASSPELASITWTEVSIPSGSTMKTGFYLGDDDANNTTCKYTRAYVPSWNGKPYVELNEWDWIKVTTHIKTDASTGPSANGDTYVGGCVVDYSGEIGEDGTVYYDWYKHTSASDPGAVGIDENPETTNGGNNGLDVGWAIEPQ